MSVCRYDFSKSVCWRDILKSIRCNVQSASLRAEHRIELVQEDIDHLYPERLDYHMRLALGDCEHVFFYVNLYNSLRQFLRYKTFTAQQLGVSFLYDFYSMYSSSKR